MLQKIPTSSRQIFLIMLNNWKHNVLLVRGISYYSTVCRFRFPDQSGKYACLIGVTKSYVICDTRPSSDHRHPGNSYYIAKSKVFPTASPVTELLTVYALGSLFLVVTDIRMAFFSFPPFLRRFWLLFSDKISTYVANKLKQLFVARCHTHSSIQQTSALEKGEDPRGGCTGCATPLPPPAPWDKAFFFVLAFKICLPQRSVTSFLRGAPPSKENPG